MPPSWNPTRFEALCRASPDPWQLQASWYEQRKRSLVLASLPRARYRSAFEPGCAQGLLTLELAARCDRLLASDCAAQALAAARERLRHQPHVRFVQAALPGQWPEGEFDLLVFSELLYYLPAAGLDALIERLRSLPAAPRTLLACHWVHPIEGCARNGREIHEQLRAALPWSCACSVRDADFALDVWTQGSPASLAAQEGRL